MIHDKSERKIRYDILIALVLLTAAILRLIALDADPPSTVGLHFISDEGWWVHNARNKILFDEWVMDEFNQSLLASPTFCFATYSAYSVFGVSYFSSRLTPVISGLLAILLFSAIISGKSPPSATFLATLLFGCNFAFTYLNRTAYVDSTALFFLLLAWWLIEYLSHRVWAVFLAGIAFALAVVTKSYVLSVCPPVALIICLRLYRNKAQIQWKDILLNVVLFAGGILATYMLWRKYIYIPFNDQYRIMYHLWKDGNFPSGIMEFLKNLPGFIVQKTGTTLTPARFIMLNASLVFLTAFRVFQHFSGASTNIRKWWNQIPEFEQEALIFLTILCCEIAPLTAKPFRRYIFLYIPMIILASRVFLPVKSNHRSPVSKLAAASVIAGCLCIITAPLIANIFPGTLPITIKYIISSVLIAGITFALIWMVLSSSKKPVVLPLTLAIVIFCFLDGAYHLHAITHRSTSLRDTSRRLSQEFFKPETVVLGGIANSLCLEGSAQAIAIWGRQEAPRVLNQDPIRRFHPDYLLILKEIDGQEWGYEERYYRYVHPENYVETIQLLPRGDGYRVIAELYRAPSDTLPEPENERLLVSL